LTVLLLVEMGGLDSVLTGDAYNKRLRDFFREKRPWGIDDSPMILDIDDWIRIPWEHVREAYAVVVAAVVLLSYVYLYLTGCGGRDGSRAVSSGSLDYRDTYIAIVLFRGAYVWIKFRDVASTRSKGVRRVPTGKYELRFKPHRENGEKIDPIHIGRFDSQADADIVYRMIVSCYPYGEDCGGLVDLAGDAPKLFPITPAFTLEEKGQVGKAKHDLVKKRVWSTTNATKQRRMP
jgi:hypothetical protein